MKDEHRIVVHGFDVIVTGDALIVLDRDGKPVARCSTMARTCKVIARLRHAERYAREEAAA